MKDFQGKEIEVGCRVAYNLSGAIALGNVIRLVKATRYSTTGFNVLITPDYAWKNLASKKGFSTVYIAVTGSYTRVSEKTDKIVVLD